MAGVSTHTIEIVEQHISHRWMYICTPDGIKWKTSVEGTPQGGILSPLLFSLTTGCLQFINQENFKISAYADDITIIAKGLSIDKKAKMWNIVEDKLNFLIKILTKCNLSYDPDKCTAMFIKN